MLLDYAATHPHAKLRFTASDMVLHIDTDAAFLVQPQAKSRVAGYYFMGSKIVNDGVPETKLNAPILVQVKTLRYTVGSAAEAEIGGLYTRGQTAIPIRQALEEMNHPQLMVYCSCVIQELSGDSLDVFLTFGSQFR